MATKKTEKDKKLKAGKITFHNKINSGFRQVHADGALGGVTSRGLINVNFYAERLAIPKSTDFTITGDGQLGAKIEDSGDSKRGIIREYEFGVYMNLETAQQLKVWLEDKINLLTTINSKKNEPTNRKK